MDFSKQLANLQQSVSRAQQRERRGDDRDDDSVNAQRRPDRGGNENYNSHGRYNQGSHGRGHDNRSRRTAPYERRGHAAQRKRHMTDSEEDFYFPRLVKAIPKYHPLPIHKKQKQRHVCLLFLTIDDLPLEHLWRAFLNDTSIHENNQSSNLMISAICHAKFPEKVQSAWLKQRLLVHKPSVRDIQQCKERYSRNTNLTSENQSCLPPTRYFSRKPEWGSVEITRAMIDLLDEGLKIGSNRDNTIAVAKSIKDSRQAQEYKEKYSSQRYVATAINHDGAASASVGNVNVMKRSSNDMIAHTGTLPTVDRFIFVSESCIPITTLAEFESALFSNDDGNETKISTQPTSTQYNGNDANKSWINARNTPNNGYARQLQWDVIDRSIPQSNIWKADQWMILTRRHAWPILKLIDDAIESVKGQSGSTNNHHSRNHLQLALWQCFRRVKASDEMYFPTVMALLGILGDRDVKGDDNSINDAMANNGDKKESSMDKEVVRRRVTYCDWSMNAKNPESFEINRKDKFKELRRVIRLAREEGCLFARKFTPILENDPSRGAIAIRGVKGEIQEAISVEEWLEIVTKMSNL